MAKGSGAESLDKLSKREVFDAENLVIDAQLLIQELLNEKQMTRTDLAKLTGVSKSRLTQIMGSDANPTLRTLAKIFTGLDEKLCLARGNHAPIVMDGRWIEAKEDMTLPARSRWSSTSVRNFREEYIARLKAFTSEPSNENKLMGTEAVLVA